MALMAFDGCFDVYSDYPTTWNINILSEGVSSDRLGLIIKELPDIIYSAIGVPMIFNWIYLFTAHILIISNPKSTSM